MEQLIKNPPYRARGFSLAELLVGLVLTGLFVASIIPVAVTARRNFTLQNNLSNMMEDGRIAIELLGKETRRAGYLRNRLIFDAEDAFEAVNSPFGIASGNLASLAAGEYIKGAADATFVDQFLIRYQLHDANEISPGFSSSPCTRNLSLEAGEDPTIQNHIISIHFYIASDNNGIPVLYCDARRDNLSDATKDKQSVALPLISNLEGMRVLYGWADSAGNVSYLNASEVDAKSDDEDWENVISARITLILQSEDTHVAEIPIASLTINGQYTHNTRNSSEKRLYRTFSTTTALRNL